MAVSRPDETSVQSPETIDELFAALESPLLAYALRLTGGREIAEDLVQEAFMKLHTQFAEVREPRRWLYRTVHNLALNRPARPTRRTRLIRNRGRMNRSRGSKASGWCG